MMGKKTQFRGRDAVAKIFSNERFSDLINVLARYSFYDRLMPFPCYFVFPVRRVFFALH